MIITFAIIVLITAGGGALTYLYEKHDSLLARLAAGNVIGLAIFATAGFLLACVFGLSSITAVAALVLTLTPLALLSNPKLIKELRHDWAKAKGKAQGATTQKTIRFGYYVFILVVLAFFFERAMIETESGIFTGGSQNLGDLPFHLGAIFSFTEGNNFPPQNPSYADAKFTYPFFADMLTAFFVKLGAGVREAMLVQNVFLGFSLVVLLEKFVMKLTGIRKTGKIAVLLLLFSGGLGFVWFLKDYWQGAQGFFEILWKLPKDYTIGEKFRWGNSLVVLFMTQRSLLFGMPLTLIALTKIWEIFAGETTDESADYGFRIFSLFPFSTFPLFLVGLFAGTLPLIHVHSLAVLFVVCGFLFFMRLDRWREWLAFGIGVAVIALPQLIWSLTGSASNLKEFIGWHFGWDSKDDNILFFWATNIGLFIPLLALGLYLISRRHPKAGEHESSDNRLILFYIPFAFLFLVSNTAKLAPWEWDNIKVLIYWFVGSLPFVAYVLAWAWQKSVVLKAAAVGAILILTLSGALDVWRTISGQISYNVFSQDSVKIAQQIKAKTPPNALFLNAPTYNSAVVLSGRRSLMRYSGHLSSYGIDYAPREGEVKRIYEGSSIAESLLRKNNIEYVIISPEETANISVSKEFFDRFPPLAQIGEHKVVQVK
ncbi:MAG: hypothetical protein IPJ30_22275 [Acidobacteria bacterium]|nr:hypothetical protein [Acidobacteriota bacterium]